MTNQQMPSIQDAYSEQARFYAGHEITWFHITDYEPMIASMGRVLAQWDEDDYQGDTIAVLERGGQFGVLIFGWGSCAGCDALQACDNWEEVDALRHSLFESIQWDTAEEVARYLLEHDWEGDFLHPPAEFIEAAVGALRNTKDQQ